LGPSVEQVWPWDRISRLCNPPSGTPKHHHRFASHSVQFPIGTSGSRYRACRGSRSVPLQTASNRVHQAKDSHTNAGTQCQMGPPHTRRNNKPMPLRLLDTRKHPGCWNNRQRAILQVRSEQEVTRPNKPRENQLAAKYTTGTNGPHRKEPKSSYRGIKRRKEMDGQLKENRGTEAMEDCEHNRANRESH